jgi:hypothetical protein
MKTVTLRIAGLLAIAAAVIFWPHERVSGQDGPRVDPSIGTPSRGPAAAKPADSQMQRLLDQESAARHTVAELVENLTRAENDKDRASLKSQLAKALENEFVAQQARRSLELDRVEAELTKVRERLRKRNDEKQTIIDKRLDQLVREAEGLGWSEPSDFPQQSSRYPRQPSTLQLK